MSIPIKKYVAITSAVGGGDAVSRKELIARVFTTNPLFPANTILEFTSSKDVADFAGALSIEAQIASTYFGWVSKRATTASKISFMRYSFDALAPFIYSTKALAPLANFKAITDGSMVVNLGGTAYTLTNIDLSAAATYADVATTLQTVIRANLTAGTLWTNAIVEYNATTNSFVLTGGETGVNTINYATAATTGQDISSVIGWDIANAPVLSDGTAEATITDVLNKTIDISTNFATFGFVSASDVISNLSAIGAWVDEQNNEYRLSFDLGSANYAENIVIANNYTGLTANYNINYGIEGLVPAWLMSSILLATTNYNKPNGVKNYMYQEFPTFPISVGNNDGNLYQTLDGLNINYNGQTQKSGKVVAFYQNGYNTNGVQTSTYDNEIWLKDAITSEMLNAFLGSDFISADNDGKAVLTGVLTEVCEEALNNHVFSTGKDLTSTQKAYITQLTGDDNAWIDVQNNGYIFTVDIKTEVNGEQTIYVGEYTLVYLKNDTINKVEGRNILI